MHREQKMGRTQDGLRQVKYRGFLLTEKEDSDGVVVGWVVQNPLKIGVAEFMGSSAKERAKEWLDAVYTNGGVRRFLSAAARLAHGEYLVNPR